MIQMQLFTDKWWNRELTLKCKINSEVLIEPINNPLGVSPIKGNQGTTRVKEIKKRFELGGNRTHDLRIRSTVC